MQDVFYAEAKKYNVLPLDNTTLTRWIAENRASPRDERSLPIRASRSVRPRHRAASILNKSYTITAEVEISEGGGEGMIVTQGGRFGGYGLFPEARAWRGISVGAR